ncbi:MAG: RidA family protein [Candidatus Limiplasma sp.]|nr:RidA family protein [Candidatus Limiplasma sp.]
MGMVENRLAELGLTLPECPVPVANFVVTQEAGELIYASGQTAWQPDRTLLYPGKVGDTVSPEEAYQSARLAALRLISELASVADLDRIKIIKLNGYVNATPEFKNHPAVVNGASDLLVAAFGENGRHARTAVGVGSLPDNASVEVEVIARRI